MATSSKSAKNTKSTKSAKTSKNTKTSKTASSSKATKTAKTTKTTKSSKTSKSSKTAKPSSKARLAKSQKEAKAGKITKSGKITGKTKEYRSDKYASFLSGNSKYFNRELSWLEFNDRILNEARDNKNPLLERLNFLSITASNLDEFYIVRVASLRDMESVDFAEKDIAGFSVKEQLTRIDEKTRVSMDLMYSTFNRSLVPALRQENIIFSSYDELDKDLKTQADEYFHSVLYPILTPLAIDAARPLPLIYNRMLNMCVMLENTPDGESLQKHINTGIKSKKEQAAQEDDCLFATVQIPTVVKRLFEIKTSDAEIFVPIEQIIRANISSLFNGQKVIATGFYRVMRNSDLDIDEDEAEDLLKEIEEQVRQRRFGEIIRLEVDDDIDPELLNFIMNELDIDGEDVFRVPGPIDLTFLSKIRSACESTHPDLCYPPHVPAIPAMFADGTDNIFEKIKAHDRFVHHPYESFDPVLEFVKQAATDPNVLAIKQTLYRVSSSSPIIASLLEAARNGKQVMVLVELKARFDEENNINWAKMLEKAGCHVIYGLVGLKTHSKITLVVREEEDGIRRYVHLATGNYNDITAKIYTDMGLFTASEPFGEDASEFFNMLSGFAIPDNWRRFIPAPLWMKDHFKAKIKREADNAREGKPARIIAKINSLVDEEIIKALYNASCAGVRIDRIVRGICCLRAGIPGMSENIHVRSITGRFLEHSRIFYFYNEGHEDLYLASADWMPRNLNRRVELMFPVEDPECRARVMEVLNVELDDTVRAHIMDFDGTYHKQDLRGKKKVDSQKDLIRLADDAMASFTTNDKLFEFIPEESSEE